MGNKYNIIQCSEYINFDFFSRKEWILFSCDLNFKGIAMATEHKVQ